MHTTMNIPFFKSILFRFVAAAGIVLMAAPAEAGVSHRIFGELLGKYNRAGDVDYAGFKKEESRLDEYLDVLATVDPDSLPRPEQFAFYVNAYNAWTIKLILSGYPGVQSIKDLGSLFRSPWKKKFVRLNGEIVTLDHIEHEILRPRFKDPRVHFAVNCASRGCPPLLAKPLTGAMLDAQLDAAARAFINDPRYNRLSGDTLYVSRIFKWFREDFNGDIAGYVAQYATGDLKKALTARKAKIRIRFLDYDWGLNGK